MSFEAFLDAPWKNSHRHYDRGVFSIRPAPEFSTAEVLVASLYRASGFPGYSENEVPKAGKEFDRTTKPTKRSQDKKGEIKLDTWRIVVHGVLESPKQRNQSSKRFLQLCQMVPETALYSGSARLVGNSWNPGALIQRMINFGATDDGAAQDLWAALHAALAVDGADDIWARWLQAEFRRHAKAPRLWETTPLSPGAPTLSGADRKGLTFPAQQFVKDLEAAIAAKPRMTRRQWISVLEAVVRLGAVMHVLWLCDVNARLWQCVSAILEDTATVPTLEQLRSELVCAQRRYLGYGNAAMADIRQYASDYLVSRLGLNAVLWGLPESQLQEVNLESCSGIHAFLRVVAEQRDRLMSNRVLSHFYSLVETEARTVACKKGIGSNLVEFARYSLGQREAAEDTLRGYDQGYVLRKQGGGRSGRWMVSFGPVAVLALVHSCLREAAGPRSVRALCDHLANYGIDAEFGDVGSGDLGKQLRMLGLILDSPDAESGMLLVPPF